MFPLMKCGHIAQATDSENKPVCPMCIGLTKDAEIIDDNRPDLTKRKALCRYCSRPCSSDFSLPFFSYNEGGETDTYYCGCYGWD